MDLVLLVLGGIALLAMVAISVWGAVTLPPGSRVPLHHGLGGWNNWQPKNVALIAWPAIGAFVYVLLLVATSHERSGSQTTPVVIAPIAMFILAFAHSNAIKTALRQSRSD